MRAFLQHVFHGTPEKQRVCAKLNARDKCVKPPPYSSELCIVFKSVLSPINCHHINISEIDVYMCNFLSKACSPEREEIIEYALRKRRLQQILKRN